MTCEHGHVYPLDSEAAVNHKDPRIGEVGYRCLQCNSVLENHPVDEYNKRVTCPKYGRPVHP